ncbi:MAG: hypothetical protein E7573_10915 [Ruminococcaceae bacterium]|nr:hypothetical protein [Oscillospiraceae bacterium]
MKRLLSVCICVSLLLSCIPFSAMAEEQKVYPTVVVPGYSASYLFAVENGEQRQIWGSIEGLNIVDVVLANIIQLGVGLGGVAFGNPQYFVDTVSGGIKEILGEIACNPDGTPVIETVTYPNDPALTNYAYLIEEEGSAHAAELEIMSDIADEYGENGYESIFSFQTDFRLSVVDAVEGLRIYIDDVLEYTGAEKVNIYAVSYGGQLTASYLNLYGHLGKVHNAVLTVPAIGGAALAYDAMSENVHLDEETLMYFIENGMMLEEDINWLMKAHSLGFLDEIINLLLKEGIKDIVGYWGSIWDFIPSEFYKSLKNEYFDSAENAALIEKSDYFHYEILPDMWIKLQECIDNGTNVYIVAGTDAPAVTGLYEQSDGIILVNGATGADCAPYGLRFSDGYQGKRSTCTDVSHNHISPSMSIDASTCYIPEQTWFVSGLFHGMTWKDDYTKELCTMLLFSDEQVSVHSYREYPQFMYSTNVCHSVNAEFDYSLNGYWQSDDTELIITNLSDKHDLSLISVECYGVDAEFYVPCNTVLSPGESVSVTFNADLPLNSFITADISVNYYLNGSITPQGERNFTFTVMNGECAENDSENKFSTDKHDTDFDKLTGSILSHILRVTGFFDFFRMIFNCFFGLFTV